MKRMLFSSAWVKKRCLLPRRSKPARIDTPPKKFSQAS